jgi:sulfur carrier protein
MTIYINGEARDVPAELNLSAVLEFFSLPTQRVAVELNKEVVRRGEWESRRVAENDRIEVIHFVGGG